ncbi:MULTISPECIES: hypothetical protein [unclassified Streptomyces]|uniref:hypothetical protein n=1 Tax=unclassified Streptomyces TaxID=2593676 RepID=UPI0036F72268
MLSWNNSALFVGLSLAGAAGGPLVHVLDYRALLCIAASVAVVGCFVAGGRLSRGRPVRRP